MRALRNLTITVEDEVARWARVQAAHQNMSVSRLVGEMLREKMKTANRYQHAKRAFFAIKPRVISEGDYPKRDEIHDRTRIR